MVLVSVMVWWFIVAVVEELGEVVEVIVKAK
jgi:hypothetical protein